MGTSTDREVRPDLWWVESLPSLADRCLLCAVPPTHGVLCSTCRTNLRAASEFSRRHLVSLMRTLVSCWDNDEKFDRAASLIVEAMRGVVVIRSVDLLELGVACGAPDAVIDRLNTNLLCAGNARTLEEVLLLMPKQEALMIMMHLGVYEELPETAVVRHVRALTPRARNSVVLSKDNAADLSELIMAWSSNEPSEHWRTKVIRSLGFGERSELRRALLEGTEGEQVGTLLGRYVDGAQFLAKSVAEAGREEAVDAYLRRVLAAQTKATREILPKEKDKKRLASGDAGAYASDEVGEDGASLWESIAAPEEGVDHKAFVSQLASASDLAPRERQILSLQSDGFTQVEIAAQLRISQPRVSQILRSLIRRLSDRVAS